ncbi:MAG: HEAT repeat domain-containing protein [Planctomycetota bacterium]
MVRPSCRWLFAALLLAGCRFAPLPPTAKIPPGYRSIRPAGPERTATAEELAAAFAKRAGDLIGVLRGGSEENRAFAREELGRMGRVAVPALAEAAKDEDDEVRGEAARALGATRCVEALVPLRALAADGGWSVREAAAEGMGRLRVKPAGETLLAMLADDAWRVRLAAIRAVGEVGESRAVPALVPLAEDVDEDVRFAAYVALARIGDPAGREAMLGGLQAPDPNVRRACAEGLGRAGRPEDVEALSRRVLDESEEVRLAVVLSMQRLSGGSLPDSARVAVETWIDALGVQDPVVEYPARQALQQLGAAAIPWLIERVAGAPEPAQVALLQLIALHPDPAAIPACEALVVTPDPMVRMAVIDLLDDIRTAESDALIVRLAAEGPSEARARALVCLAASNSAKAEEAFTAALADADPLLRRVAIALISLLPAAGQLAPLVGVLDGDKDESVRIEAVKQLGAIDSAEARDRLTREWELSKGVEIRREVLQALARQTAGVPMNVLLAALADADPATRDAALGVVIRDGGEEAVAQLEMATDPNRPEQPSLPPGDGPWPAALLALARLAPERALVRVREWEARGMSARGRLTAIQALACIPTPESAHLLEAFLRAQELDLASAALDALEAMPAEIAAPVVLRVACEHEDVMLRSDAAMAFAFWGYVGAAPKLRERLAVEEDPNVRCALVSALGWLQDEASAPAIAEAARSEDPRTRTQALTVLGLVGTQAAIPPLVEALKDPDPSIRQLGVEALGNLRAEEGVAALVERIVDPEEQVRRAAVHALAGYGDKAREPLLIDAMRALHPDLQDDALRLAAAKEFLQLGHPALARAEFENVLRSEPQGGGGDLEAHLHLSYLLAAERDFEGAATHGRARLMMLPTDSADRTEAEVGYALLHGVVLLREGREAKGLQEIEAGLAACHRDAMALNNVAFFLAEGRVGLEKAAALVDEAMRKMPDDPNILDTAGWIAYLQGDFAGARDLLSKAMLKGPTSGDVAYHLAKTEMALAEVDSALGHLKRAAELDSSLARKASQDIAFRPVVNDTRFKRLLSPAGSR